MREPRRPSAQTVAVLKALAAEPEEWRHGYDLGIEVGLKSGSLYPILMRLSDRGYLEAQWERDGPPGRPPRHLYRLTPDGRAFTDSVTSAAVAPVRSPSPKRQAGAGLRGAW